MTDRLKRSSWETLQCATLREQRHSTFCVTLFHVEDRQVIASSLTASLPPVPTQPLRSQNYRARRRLLTPTHHADAIKILLRIDVTFWKKNKNALTRYTELETFREERHQAYVLLSVQLSVAAGMYVNCIIRPPPVHTKIRTVQATRVPFSRQKRPPSSSPFIQPSSPTGLDWDIPSSRVK